MTKKSDFQPCSPGAGSAPYHTCAIEFVPNSKRPREIYIVFDGKRVAARGYDPEHDRDVWLPVVDGYEVADESDGNISVFVRRERLQ